MSKEEYQQILDEEPESIVKGAVELLANLSVASMQSRLQDNLCVITEEMETLSKMLEAYTKACFSEQEKTVKKYELTDETRAIDGHILHRIRALRDFTDVRAGDLGGWIECEDNLSHDGNCWIHNNAYVFDQARVSDNARVYDTALVYDKAIIEGDAEIRDTATIKDCAHISGGALIYERARMSVRSP